MQGRNLGLFFGVGAFPFPAFEEMCSCHRHILAISELGQSESDDAMGLRLAGVEARLFAAEQAFRSAPVTAVGR
jgi:hypothetical protein